MNEQVCGTCKWHAFENIDDDWVCVCDESDHCTDWTDYTDTCEEWEERE